MSQPKKSLGQHWLFDETSLRAMLAAGDVGAEDVVLEVGPGLGTLTKKLCQTAQHVIAVELDDALAGELEANMHSSFLRRQESSHQAITESDAHNVWTPDQAGAGKIKNLTVMNQSILDFDYSTLPSGYKVIANIPYYLTSNLVRKLLEAENKPAVVVLLIQKEVAERIVAEPGKMSILSVSVQFYAEVELRELVPAELFTPPPKVDSQIIKITPRTQALFSDIDQKLFFKIVKAGFSEKRKKIRSSLSGGLQLEKSVVDLWLQKAEISPDARAQELSLNDWHDIYLNR